VGPEVTPVLRLDQSSAPDGGGVYFTLVDLHGSVSYVLNSTPNAAPVNVITYTAFGIMQQSAPMSYTLGLFAYDGYFYDSDTYLFMVGARVYDAQSQRWMQQDPIGFGSGDANPYRYVSNSPTTASDPSGLAASDYVGAFFRTALSVDPFQFAIRAFWNADGMAADWDLLTGGTSTRVLNSRTTGAVVDAVDGTAAGWAHSLTAGGSTRLRTAIWGETATRNHTGGWFTTGQVIGGVHALALGFVNPCAATAGIQAGFRAIQGAQAIGGTINAVENFSQGNYLGGALDLAGVGANAFLLSRVCFTGDTPIITKRGSIRFDQLREGDEVLSGPEEDPTASPEWRRVEEIFRNVLPIWHVHVKGQVIRSTAEHPFFVWGKGWVKACALQPGDLLRSHDGQMVAVDDVCDGGYEETVYNCRIAEYHTYFVGGDDWGFSVWAHNTCAGYHHYVPRFMGSDVGYGNKILTWLSGKSHTAMHDAMYSFLSDKGMYWWKGQTWMVANFGRTDRLKALVEFYKSYNGGAHLNDFIVELRATVRAGKLL
jgi:RHS repeat-associated protein